VTNSGTVQVGNGSVATTVTAQGFANTGTINIDGGSTNQALSNIAAARDLVRHARHLRQRAVGICRQRRDQHHRQQRADEGHILRPSWWYSTLALIAVGWDLPTHHSGRTKCSGNALGGHCNFNRSQWVCFDE
jgi:hypothetical protein